MSSTTYFLTFLLALVVLITTTSSAATDPNGTLDEPKQATSRFRSRHLGKIKHHPSKSVEKSFGRAHDDDEATRWAAKTTKHTRARRTAEKNMEKLATDDQDRTEGRVSGAKNMNLENNGRGMPEGNMPEYFVRGFNYKGTTTEKLEEGAKDKTIGYRAKASDHVRKYENMHQ